MSRCHYLVLLLSLCPLLFVSLDEARGELIHPSLETTYFRSSPSIHELFLSLIDYTATKKSTTEPSNQKYLLAPFHTVVIDGDFAISLNEGREHSIELLGSKERIDCVEIKVDGSTLVVRYDKKRCDPHGREKIQLKIQTLAMDKITLRGNIDLRVDEEWRSDRIDILTKGHSQIFIANMKTDQLHIHGSGSSLYRIFGNANKQSISLDGACEFDGRALFGKEGIVEIKGSSLSRLNLEETLFINGQATTEVQFFPHPKLFIHSSGSADILAMEASATL